jgi:hypothetical protein
MVLTSNNNWFWNRNGITNLAIFYSQYKCVCFQNLNNSVPPYSWLWLQWTSFVIYFEFKSSELTYNVIQNPFRLFCLKQKNLYGSSIKKSRLWHQFRSLEFEQWIFLSKKIYWWSRTSQDKLINETVPFLLVFLRLFLLVSLGLRTWRTTRKRKFKSNNYTVLHSIHHSQLP